jgi:hypothetical protein
VEKAKGRWLDFAERSKERAKLLSRNVRRFIKVGSVEK